MMKRAGDIAQSPSAWALRELPARAATFLYTVGADASLRGALQAGGYRPSDHEEGLRLLCAACSYQSAGHDRAEDDRARGAEAALLEWTGTHLGRLRLAVERLHPEAAYLFADLAPKRAAEATFAVATLLRRLESQPPSPGAAALQLTLVRRGLTLAERQRLQGLLAAARSAPAPERAGPGQGGPKLAPVGTSAATPALHALYLWHADWAHTAQTLVQRKDWLERLGLVRRRRRAPA